MDERRLPAHIGVVALEQLGRRGGVANMFTTLDKTCKAWTLAQQHRFLPFSTHEQGLEVFFKKKKKLRVGEFRPLFLGVSDGGA